MGVECVEEASALGRLLTQSEKAHVPELQFHDSVNAIQSLGLSFDFSSQRRYARTCAYPGFHHPTCAPFRSVYGPLSPTVSYSQCRGKRREASEVRTDLLF